MILQYILDWLFMHKLRKGYQVETWATEYVKRRLFIRTGYINTYSLDLTEEAKDFLLQNEHVWKWEWVWKRKTHHEGTYYVCFSRKEHAAMFMLAYGGISN